MKYSYNLKSKFLLISTLTMTLLSGCANSDVETPFNSGRTSTELIQKGFRESILSRFEEKNTAPLVIAQAGSPSREPGVRVNESPELLAWRDSIGKQWEPYSSKDLSVACELFYEALVDEKSSLAETFAQTRNGLAAQGTSIYSIKNISLLEDNRKTIQFPTESSTSSLFVCRATIMFKLTNGAITNNLDSTIAWNYYFRDGQIKWTISFNAKG